MALTYADLVYDGRWFTPLKYAMDAFIAHTQSVVTGTVKLKLYKGNIVLAGTKAEKSLYLQDLASFTDTELYDQKDADGFIKLFGLPLKVQGLVDRKGG